MIIKSEFRKDGIEHHWRKVRAAKRSEIANKKWAEVVSKV